MITLLPGDCYYFMDGCGNVQQCTWSGDEIDQRRLAEGNVLRPGLTMSLFDHLLRAADHPEQIGAIAQCVDRCQAVAPFLSKSDYAQLAATLSKCKIKIEGVGT